MAANGQSAEQVNNSDKKDPINDQNKEQIDLKDIEVQEMGEQEQQQLQGRPLENTSKVSH